jgi:hypothetical protein
MSRRMMGKTNVAPGLPAATTPRGTPPRPRDRPAGMPARGGLPGRGTLPEPFVQLSAELASLYSYAHPGQVDEKGGRQVERSEEST